MTSAQGTVTSCGPGQTFSLQYTCTGPSCVDLDGIPGITCTTDGTTLTCTNGVTCPPPTNYTSEFTLTQSDVIVSQTQKIVLKDFCEDINLTSDGTTGGTNTTMVKTGPCGPGNPISSMSSSSSTTATSNQHSSSTSSTSLSTSTSSTTPKQPSTTSTSTASEKSSTSTSTTPKQPTTTTSSTTSKKSSTPTTSITSKQPTTTTSSTTSKKSSTSTTSTTSKQPTTTTSSTTSKKSSTSTASSSTSSKKSSTTGSSTTPKQTSSTNSIHSTPSTNTISSTAAKQISTASSVPIASTSSGTKSSQIASGSSGALPAAGSQSTGSGAASSKSSTGGSSTATSAKPPSSSPSTVKSSNASSFRHGNQPAFWCVLLLLFTFLAQGTLASTHNPHATHELDPYNSVQLNHTHIELAKRELTPGWKAFSDIFSEYLAGKITKPEFADNLVEELEELVCDHAVGLVITDALGVDLVETCVTAIYTGNALVAPELEFLSVFGASILCNLLVSEALPGIGALTDAICMQPKPCSEDLLTDPKNCGACGNMCSTGVCANGACTSNVCTGQVCATFSACGPGASCVCASTTEETGYCVDGSTPCAGLANCGDSTNCASGEICAVGTCCETNVCVGATFCGGDETSAKSRAMFLRRTWENATIASLGTWVV